MDRVIVASGDAATVSPAPQEMVLLAEGASDLFVRVNSSLAEAKLSQFSKKAMVRVSDLGVLRTIVKDSEARVSRAEDGWLDAARAVLGPREQELIRRIGQGEAQDHLLASSRNSLRRLHPREAVSETLVGGKKYVLRVLPQDDKLLATAGESLDVEIQRRASDYNTMVRALVVD